jgi:hypothetical protein
VQLTVGEHAHARGPRLELDADLLGQLGHVSIGGEQMVVVALDQHAADVDRRRLAAEPRPALVDIGLVTDLRQAMRRGEPGDSGSEDGHPHGSRP